MKVNNPEVVVLSGVRTAIGTYGGSLKNHAPTDLAGTVVREAMARADINPERVGHCVFGHVVDSDPSDMYMGRVAAMKGGMSEKVPALTVNRLCGSGLQALVSAAQQIETGACDCVVAGGAESMSRAVYWVPNARFGYRMGDGALVDAMVGALTCPIEKIHMGITAENIAEKWGITREAQDQAAVASHNRAQHAIEQGYFKEQIVPIELLSRKGVTRFDTDEHVRHHCTLDDMAKLKPAFKKEGTVTAGNASGLNDAAAALVLMERQAAEDQGLKPMARLLGYSFAGVEPKYMGIGPVPAIRQLLENANLSVTDIDIWEINEAFAAQALAVAGDLEIPVDKLNPNGSGIALGHPIGATGAILAVKALHELKRIQGRYAVVSLCIGGGQGIAALFERY
ncbi:beta-ketothiolase BktB [uncultured Marinobacter sp.]|jgi:acetyl-CoA C-acetyltransferase|uniref:beta-ketothiolase BktB n=1 Tax=uncultured Marinobacter sp. TaxID=187379 RepID=UPI000EC4C29D|nr:acetyl-CoA C-acyltransferase [Marinobacter nauticus]|tara:strand:+ start:20634 stop:21824 length:1191 start_codon:yes stop_codon:yes gene_type:complete